MLCHEHPQSGVQRDGIATAARHHPRGILEVDGALNRVIQSLGGADPAPEFPAAVLLLARCPEATITPPLEASQTNRRRDSGVLQEESDRDVA
jgi:hypothetical protein